MIHAPAGVPAAAPEPIVAGESEAGIPAAPPGQSAPRHIVRSGKRAEDTALGCRANAAANLARANAPGGDYMRVRLEHSATVWSARADLLDRLETKLRKRTPAD
jgi:hypothetical protein